MAQAMGAAPGGALCAMKQGPFAVVKRVDEQRQQRLAAYAEYGAMPRYHAPHYELPTTWVMALPSSL